MTSTEAAKEALFARRVLELSGSISADTASPIITGIQRLTALDPQRPITLTIDCIGGNIRSEYSLIDAVRHSTADIHGLVTTCARSAAFNLLQYCAYRMAWAGADFMFHAPNLNGVRIDQEDFEEVVERTRATHDEFLDHLVQRTRPDREQWVRWSREERTFSAAEALEHGIIDRIVPTPAP